MAERFDPRTLPPSIRDARTLGFAAMIGEALAEPDFGRTVMEWVETAPAEALPALVREFSIEEFVEPGMTEAVIRRLIAGAYDLHAAKGHLAGIRRGLALIGMRADWEQWFDMAPPGAPGTHRATVYAQEFLFANPGALLDGRTIRAAVRMVHGMQRWSQEIDLRIGVATGATVAPAGVAQALALARPDLVAQVAMPAADLAAGAVAAGLVLARPALDARVPMPEGRPGFVAVLQSLAVLRLACDLAVGPGGPDAPARRWPLPLIGVNHIAGYSQSQGVGHDAYPALSVDPMPGTYMLGDGVRPRPISATSFEPYGHAAVLKPLVAKTELDDRILTAAEEAALPVLSRGLGEAPIVAAVRGAKIAVNRVIGGLGAPADDSRKLVATAAGASGRSVFDLRPDTTQPLRWWDRFADGLVKVKTAADALSLPSQCAGLLYDQGAADYFTGVPRAEYAAALDALLSAMSAAAVDTYGQAKAPPIFIMQEAAQYTRDVDRDGVPGLAVGMAQRDVARARADTFLIGPWYAYPDKGGHTTANGSRWHGAQTAKVWRKVVLEGEDWRPLEPVEVEASRQTVVVRFHVPAPPLQWRPVWRGLTPVWFPGRGFRVTDAAGDVPFASVPVTAGVDRVVIKLARPIEGTGALWYADATVHAGHGNLCDSDPEVAADLYAYTAGSGQAPAENLADLVGRPYPLWNWATAHHSPLNWSLAA